jgi:hypothetical protein
MRETAQANKSADESSGGVVTHEVPPGIGSKMPIIRNQIRPRSRRAAKVASDVITPRRSRPDRDSDMVRSSMEAGLSRGVSIVFGEFDSRR